MLYDGKAALATRLQGTGFAEGALFVLPAPLDCVVLIEDDAARIDYDVVSGMLSGIIVEARDTTVRLNRGGQVCIQGASGGQSGRQPGAAHLKAGGVSDPL